MFIPVCVKISDVPDQEAMGVDASDAVARRQTEVHPPRVDVGEPPESERRLADDDPSALRPEHRLHELRVRAQGQRANAIETLRAPLELTSGRQGSNTSRGDAALPSLFDGEEAVLFAGDLNQGFGYASHDDNSAS